MTIRASGDGGRTWRSALTLSDAPAAYSDLVQLGTRTVGLLYETGVNGSSETITFRQLPMQDLD
jgi:sialidase-1